MDITLNDYILIRKTIIDMLYDRSEQDLKRFYFERGSLDIYNMIPTEVIENIFIEAISSVGGGSGTKKKGDPFNLIDMEFKNSSQRVVVHFMKDATKLDENILKTRLNYNMKSNEHLICILCNNNKPINSLLITNLDNTEIFWYKQLTFNVSKHYLVPKHELLEPFKKDEIKKKLYLNSIKSLPSILSVDPIAKYYYMKPGDVCKITRHSINIGESIYYRLVVSE